MSDELEPLDFLAEDLFRAERDHLAPVDPARSARIYAKIAETVAFTPPVIDASRAPTAPTAPTDPAAPTTAPNAPVATGLTAKALAPWVLSAFFGGVVTGILAGGVVDSPKPSTLVPPVVTTIVDPAPNESKPLLQVGPSASVMRAPPATVTVSGSAPKPSSPQPTSSADTNPQTLDKSLTAERALVERARVALSRHQGTMALDALAEHETTFPRGRLVEEREALRVRALVDAGRRSEAEAKARAFRARWPNSVFLSAVDLAIAPR